MNLFNMTGTFDLTSLIEHLESLTTQRNYWMVRTMGGNYYGDFIRHGYVAFGYDAITLEDLSTFLNMATTLHKCCIFIGR